ncbi:MAG: LPXTG cell wall anchor domain-containing protein [Pseudobutyrivibrio sp.]|nr:LPXTG cell wall anchor domain-containing protein [Pseudobutyrivibrio sp.]
MAKRKTFKNRLLSIIMVLAMTALIWVPAAAPVQAVEDSITVGQPAFNAANGTMTYYNCVGTGANLYKSIVVNFTSVRENNEYCELPSMTGFTYETSLSTPGTYIINIPEGKNLVEIAKYIRKIQFVNCQNSSQKINFSIGKDIVKYMTFYSEDSEHYYQFIKFDKSSGTAVSDPTGKSWSYGTWEWAYYTALNMQYEGLQGYLATVTDVKEDAFIYKASNEIGWLGGTKMNHGAQDSKNGIPYYKTFTRPSSISDQGIGYWYWASGPDVNEGGGKFLHTYTAASNSVLQTADGYGYYNNWNSGEPNNSNGEFAMTTLKIGSGWNTGNRNGKIGTSSPYYVESGYSWNDIVDTNWARYGSSSVTNYTATGFFVEYGDYVKGLSKTALVQKTNFEFKTTTQPLSHIWNLYAADGSDTIHMYCTASDPKCSYFATGHTTLGATIDVVIKADDKAYDGSKYNLASVDGESSVNFASSGNYVLSEIKYYKATTQNQTSGGTALGTTAPTDIGYYYAEVTLAVTNTKLATNTVTAKAVAPFKIYDPDAEFDVDKLNNKSNADSVAYQRKVTQNTAVADLDVVLATETDTLTMYKIAEMPWDTKTDTLGKMKWVDEVQAWIDANPNYRTSVKTPYELSNGKASSSTIQSFYKDMLKSGADSVIVQGNLTDIVAEPAGYVSKEAIYSDGTNIQIDSTAPGAYKYAYRFNDIEYGIYAILAYNGDSGYAVTVAAVYPQQSGPTGEFYTQELFTVYIKEVEPTIDKYINGEKEDILTINDYEHPVKFTVDFQLPEYKDRVTSANDSGYQLYFQDDMANGYTFYEVEGSDEYTVKFYYTYATEEDPNNTLTDLIDRNAIPKSSPYKFTDSGSESNKLTAENVATYTKNTDLVGKYYTRRSNVPIYNEFEVVANNDGSTTIRIDFDEPAIRAWKNDLKTQERRNVSGFKIEYYAILDEDATINSHDNSNTAYIYYEKDSTGSKMTEMHDTVYGYTYGLNIVKIDGSASERAYLAGAQFQLFKEMIGDFTDEQIAAFEADPTNYYIYTVSGSSNTTSDNTGTASEPEEQGGSGEPGENEEQGGNAQGAQNVQNPQNSNSSNTVTRYFKKVVMNNGVFTQGTSGEYDTLVSVGTEAGITAHGLSDGNYILVETQAPRGYNELAEDIYFEINRLTSLEEEMKTLDQSLIWFREISPNYDPTNVETAVINQNGCISLDIYNYQGLVLPSTGGIGILLFVIIGVAITGGVIILIITRRRAMAQQ